MLKRLSIVAIVLMVLSQLAVAQYSMTLQNDALVAGNMAYEFDVYIASTSGTINLTSYQVFFTYNTAIAGSGTLSFSYVGGTALTNPPNLGVGIYSDNGSNLGAASNAGTDNITTTPVKVGRFRITNTVVFPIEQANVAWDFLGGLATVVNLNNADATLAGNHHSTLDNLPLPVTLVSFTGSASASKGGVVLEWKTASEVNNYGYTVQRKANDEASFADLNAAFIAGKGTTVEPQEYSYVDKSLTKAGSYSYRLKQQDLDGTIHYSQSLIVNVTVTDVAEVAPKVFQLLQNYPNPFNPSTQVKFSVETTERAVVKVYNMIGAEVATLFDGTAEAGRYYVTPFNATGLASGIYFYRLTTAQKTDVRKMLLVK
jgi:hypothetical protein